MHDTYVHTVSLWQLPNDAFQLGRVWTAVGAASVSFLRRRFASGQRGALENWCSLASGRIAYCRRFSWIAGILFDEADLFLYGATQQAVARRR